MNENNMNGFEEEKLPPDSETPAAEVPSSQTEPEVSEKPTVVYAFRWNYEEQNRHDQEKIKQQNRKGFFNFALVMSIALFSAIALLIGVLLLDPADERTVLGGNGASLELLYEECHPSYVAISVITETGGSTAGSGIIMTSNGYIVTNHHVVEDANSISVILYDGTTIPADYVDGDDLNDIAVIKVAETGLKPAKIGKSSKLKVGEQVMAIGTPHSISYRGTMTSGYVSSVRRFYAAQNDNGTIQKVVPLIQTDTSVNPGNSGGPLFNMKGEVIGIVSMKIAGSQYEGLGFAIPIDGVLDMINDIIQNGRLTISNGGSAFQGAALGVTGMSVVKDTTYLFGDDLIVVTVLNEKGELCVETTLGDYIPITDTEAMEEMGIVDYEMFKAPATGGLIMSTQDGFDSAKKLKQYDIIVTANGINCPHFEMIKSIVTTCRAGDILDLKLWRDGELISVSVELGSSSAMN